MSQQRRRQDFAASGSAGPSPVDNSHPQTISTGARVAIGVSIGLIVAVIIALATAFIWPGWADKLANNQQQENVEPTVKRRKAIAPSTSVTPLPSSATELVKHMPDTVGAYARKGIEESSNWKNAKPIEEHTITYSTGTDHGSVTLVVAQWPEADTAGTEYQKLVSHLTGEKVEAGNVRVAGNITGAYQFHRVGSTGGIALWRNDTCIFQVSGPFDAVKEFYTSFPL
jgi:hypothetical protein